METYRSRVIPAATVQHQRRAASASAGLTCTDTRRQAGFTLVELIVAMTLSMIVVSFAAMFIKTPMEIYRGQSRRAELVDAADQALRDISRDVRAALPNSVRVTTNGGVQALELLATVDAVRYRDSDSLTAPGDELDLAAPDAQFSTIGAFEGAPRSAGVFTAPDAANNIPPHYLAIYNVGVPGADAYQLTDVITPSGTTIQIASSAANEDQVTLNPAFRFAFGSPGRRIYLVSGPVTFLCDTVNRTLTRYSEYPIQATQRNSAADFSGAGVRTLLARNVAACTFTYAPGIAERTALLTMALTVERDGERVRLLHQVHVENAP